MLAAAGLGCQRGDAMLFRDLSFKVEAGQALLVRGANGSGKTSLLRILAGLATPVAGGVSWTGATDAAARRAVTAYQGHVPALKDDLTVQENLAFALALDGVAADAAAQQEAIKAVGLAKRRHLPARHLSQGQRRRVGLARLMLTKSRPLWLLDEPATALDSEAITLFCAALDRHLAQGGVAVLSTHQNLPLASAATELTL